MLCLASGTLIGRLTGQLSTNGQTGGGGIHLNLNIRIFIFIISPFNTIFHVTQAEL